MNPRVRPGSGATILLVALLLLGAAVRVWGIEFGLPHFLTRPDEEVLAQISASFFSGSFNPHFFDWPSLSFYIVHAILRIIYVVGHLFGAFSDRPQFANSILMSPGWVLLMNRFIVAGCGVATLVVVFRLTRRMTDVPTALVATFFLSVAFLHVRDSHFGMLEVPMTLLIVISVFTLVKAAEERSVRRFVAAGIWAGLATSLKYNAGALIAVALAAGGIVFVEARSLRRIAVLGVIGFGIAFAISFLVGTPYALLDVRAFLNGLRYQRNHFLTGHGIAIAHPYLHYLNFSLRHGLGAPMLVAGLVGIPVLFNANWRRGLLLFSFPLVYYTVLGASPTAFVRYAVPLTPFMCIAAAVAVCGVVSRLFRGSTAAFGTGVVSLAIAMPSILSVIAFDRLMTMRDTRLLASDWLASNRPPDSTLFQTGVLYVHVSVASTTPSWSLDYNEDRGMFFRNDGSQAPEPDWIVVADSPLPTQTSSPRQLREILQRDYTLVQTFTSTTAREPEDWFDRQDAFFVPYVDFRYRIRPGPDLYIYRRRANRSTM